MVVEYMNEGPEPYYCASQRRPNGRLVIVESPSRQGAMDALLRILAGAEEPVKRPLLRLVRVDGGAHGW